ncbi:fas-binding factor 1 homolog, partial [Limulus polyphemus]|uniref:Fas-binding factor 1 homolog n=1 Tax=Limulus polyphemus TaxID=6850 RepID=A0ABM1RUP0_LIMPO
MADEEEDISSDFSDPDEIAKSLAGLDDLDDNLFGSSLKTPKTDGQKVNPSRAEKKQTQRKTSIDFDDDDPLAGLLSDDEDIPQKSSSGKRNTSLKTKNADLHEAEKDKDFGVKAKESFFPDKGKSSETPLPQPKKEEKIEESQPKKSNSPPQQSGRRGVRRQLKNDIGFGDDDLDILGGMGLSEETGKEKEDKPKNKSFLDDLLGEKPETKEKSRTKEFVLDDKYKNNKSEEDNEFHFGGYNPSAASEQRSGSGPKRSV